MQARVDPLEAQEVFAQALIRLRVREEAVRADAGEVRIQPQLGYSPHAPHPKQRIFLDLSTMEAFYGGAAGGGKSDAILMAALQYVHIPGYAALILRRTFPDLSLPGAIMSRSHEWLGGSNARWTAGRTWRFPSGATITFGYLQHEKDVHQYQSAEFQFIGIDELTQFTESQYVYMFSRLRRPSGLSDKAHLSSVPLRYRSASNPGNVGHDWVRQRFIDSPEDRVFIPARLDDNPSLDYASYVESLMHLDPVRRAQLLEGDWEVRASSGFFKREDFPIVDVAPSLNITWVRYWDLASTPVSELAPDPDWSRGTRVGLTTEGIYYVSDVVGIRESPGIVRKVVRQTAQMDGITTWVRIEEEGGASGKDLVYNYSKELSGYNFAGDRSTGSKELRATVVSNEASAGNVRLVRGEWISPFLSELEGFPFAAHDDYVDSLSGGFKILKAVPEVSRQYDGWSGEDIGANGLPQQGEPGWDPYLERDYAR